MEDWRLYEQQIFEKFQKEFPNDKLFKDYKIKGRKSKASRQIDIYVTGSLVGREITGAIECKHFNKKVDVKHIDAFFGMLDDIGADFGIIISNKGFTTAAMNSAHVRKIKIDVVKFAELDFYHFNWDTCEVCQVAHGWHNEIYWHYGQYKRSDRDTKLNIRVGRCSVCDTMHIKCHDVMAVWDTDYDEPKECSCGKRYLVERHYDNDEVPEEIVYLLIGQKKIELVFKSNRKPPFLS